MTQEELLVQLRDIGPPAEPAWWLPATGHLVIALVFSVAFAMFVAWYLRHRASRFLLQARRDLEGIEAGYRQDPNPARTACELSRWLKTVALAAYPERNLEALNGGKWLEFLDRSLGEDSFSNGAGQLFGGEAYRRQPEFDEARVFELCRTWLERVAPGLRGARKS